MARIDTNYIDPSIYSNTRAVVANPVTPGINPSVETPSFNTSYGGTVPQYSGLGSGQTFTGAPSTDPWGNQGAYMINGAHELTNLAVNQRQYQSPQVQEAVSKTIDKSYLSLPSVDEIVEDAVQEIIVATGVSEDEARKIVEGNGTKENPGLRGMLKAVDPSTGLTRYDQMLLSHGRDIADAINNQVAGNQTSKQTNEIIQASKQRLTSTINAMKSAYLASGETKAAYEQYRTAREAIETSIAASVDDPDSVETLETVSQGKQIADMLAQNEIGATDSIGYLTDISANELGPGAGAEEIG